MKKQNMSLWKNIAVLLLTLPMVFCSCYSTAVMPASTSTPPAGTIPGASQAPVKLEIKTNRADIGFPDKVTFYLDATAASPITGVSLEYFTDKRAISKETTRVEPQYTPGEHISASWSLEMKKSGSLPPGSVITWQWKTTDKTGAVYTTPLKTLQYNDTRFDWKLKSTKIMDIYWFSQTENMMNTMTAGLEAKLTAIKLPADFAPGRKPKIFLYANSEEIKGAILFQKEWVGALAFPDYNVILIPCSLEMLSWCSGALAHEVTHLIVSENVFGPFGDLPTWLNEGLARYSEGDIPDYDRQLMSDAVKGGKTISIRSLGGSFPADAGSAHLAYAESGSIVRYMVTTGGWEKMQALLAVFKEGSSNDNALKKVYGVDIASLEKQWLEWVKKQ